MCAFCSLYYIVSFSFIKYRPLIFMCHEMCKFACRTVRKTIAENTDKAINEHMCSMPTDTLRNNLSTRISPIKHRWNQPAGGWPAFVSTSDDDIADVLNRAIKMSRNKFSVTIFDQQKQTNTRWLDDVTEHPYDLTQGCAPLMPSMYRTRMNESAHSQTDDRQHNMTIAGHCNEIATFD